MRRHMAREFRRDGGDAVGELGRFDLVDLGEDRLVRDGGLVEQLHQRSVGLLDAVARIDQQQGAPQARPAAQIAVYQRGPALDVALRDFGEAIARQVDQHQPSRQVKEIELLRAPGPVRDARQGVAAGERVDQGRLADIGAAGKGDLGQPVEWQRRVHGGAGDEIASAGEEPAAGFLGGGIGRLRRRIDHVGRGFRRAGHRD